MFKKKNAVIALALAGTLLLSACGGGGHQVPAAPQNDSLGSYTGPQALANFQWGASYLRDASYVGPASFGSMGVDVAVAMHDAQGLIRYAQMVSDPTSGVYRHFLTPKQIANQFGASQQDYTAAAKYFAGHGLHVGGWSQRLMLYVSGSQANLESAFGTKFGLYQKNGMRFVAPKTAPHFDRVIPVMAVGRLISAMRVKSFMIPVRAGNNTFAGYSPQQIQNAFDYSGAYKAGYTGTGITVGIIGTGPISSNDVPTFGALYKTKVATVTQAPVTDSGEAAGLTQAGIPTPEPNPSNSPQPPYAYGDFGLATPPPVTMPCNQQFNTPSLPTLSSEVPTNGCNPEDGEAQLDTEQVASLAPGASVSFYLGFNPADCAGNVCDQYIPGGLGLEGIAVADDEIQQAISDNNVDVLSLSFGQGETDASGYYYDSTGAGFEPMEFAALAAEGIAVFVSSGDAGAEECGNGTSPCSAYPSGDVNVTSVGGITAALNSFGQPTSQFTAWGYQTQGGFTGSGGGTSSIFHAPPWQAQNISPAPTMRLQPDVSLLADQNTGVPIVENVIGPNQGQVGLTGGTSVAAPQMAAMWALVLQACHQASACGNGATGNHPYRLGNPAPLLYAIYGGKYAPSAGNPASFAPHLPYSQTFFDVIYGDTAQADLNATPPPGGINPPGISGCCTAHTGYDETTGIGVPFAGHLIQAVTGQAAP
ncbi:MAG: S53 family peptidase [Vulcanimicrobiaceae bacterium]